MRKLNLILFITISSFAFAQNWTSEQIAMANTAKGIEYLTEAEIETVLYINLARLYPKLFIKNEVDNYFGTKRYGDYLINSEYRQSLIVELEKMKPVEALVFSRALYENARCFAEESGNAGTVGHIRKDCTKENYAECCSYGMDTGIDIAMHLLIDHNVRSLGHRKISLNEYYSIIGLSVYYHKKWDVCAVVEFR